MERRLCGASSLGSLLSGATSANTSTLSNHKLRVFRRVLSFPLSTAASSNVISELSGQKVPRTSAKGAASTAASAAATTSGFFDTERCLELFEVNHVVQANAAPLHVLGRHWRAVHVGLNHRPQVHIVLLHARLDATLLAPTLAVPHRGGPG